MIHRFKVFRPFKDFLWTFLDNIRLECYFEIPNDLDNFGLDHNQILKIYHLSYWIPLT